jgi:alpha-N-arabinofuranosidase
VLVCGKACLLSLTLAKEVKYLSSNSGVEILKIKTISKAAVLLGLCFVVTVGCTAAGKTQEIGPAKSIELAVTIDVSKTGEPISKYIYGQFIEHLGRCIDGGVWAEMLQDRKFYHPVTQNFVAWSTTKGDGPLGNDDFPILVGSPWEVIGGRDIVEMVKQDSFRGGHTPQVHLTGYNAAGIAQNKLGLIKGKKYTGRIVLAGDPQAAPIKVSLKWNNDKDGKDTLTINKIESNFATYPLRFEAGAHDHIVPKFWGGKAAERIAKIIAEA